MEIKPYQIDELVTEHGDILLSALRTAVLTGLTHTCTACGGAGLVPDLDNPPAVKEDPWCEGYGKTQYLLVEQPNPDPQYLPDIPEEPEP